MCGIAGMVSLGSGPATGESVLAMAQALERRGPDGAGYWRLAGDEAGLCGPEEFSHPADIFFAHRRLSIVNLEGGAEPISDGETRWEEWGEDLFGRLNGIFAFAIADVRKRELIPAEGGQAALGAVGAPDLTRRRTVLHAPAQWFEASPKPATEAA